MIKMSLKLNGHEIRPENLARDLTKSLFADTKKLISRKIEDCICPVHGTRAKARPIADQPGRLMFETEFCCEAHKAAATKFAGGRHA